MALPQSGSSTTDSRWNLEMLVFVEGGKPENPEKKPRSKDENQQKPTHDTGTGNRTRATLVGGERSHRCLRTVSILSVRYQSMRERKLKRKVVLELTQRI